MSQRDAYAVDVEIRFDPRACDSMTPVFRMVGLPDAAVRESRERIRVAIKNCDFFPIHVPVTFHVGCRDEPLRLGLPNNSKREGRKSERFHRRGDYLAATA
jgi:hypothetical protein